eukprot:GAFH01001020.1.p1 GENE.GAFH01001020.1~~GAFH01001020.1.p1  ORF type:complete len:319 (-),score=100.96 GAFH01001020.1:311-1267(-)
MTPGPYEDMQQAHPIQAPTPIRTDPAYRENDKIALLPAEPSCCLGPQVGRWFSAHIPFLCGPKASRFTALKEGSFWLLCAVFLLNTGVGLTVINNAGQLVSDEWRATIVIFLSLANAAGRFTFGNLSDLLRGKVSNPQLFTCACCIMCAAHTLLKFTLAYDGVVIMACLMAAFAYGGMFCICPTTVSMWYGAGNFGFNNGVVQLGTGFGGMFLNILMGEMVDAWGGFSSPLIMTSLVSAAGAAFSVALWPYHKKYLNAAAAAPLIKQLNDMEAARTPTPAPAMEMTQVMEPPVVQVQRPAMSGAYTDIAGRDLGLARA